MTLIPVEELKKRVASIAVKGGIPAEDADMLAETLVVTDMRGVHSQNPPPYRQTGPRAWPFSHAT